MFLWWSGNGTLEFNEFHDMMKTTLDGTTRWEKLKKAHTPPDTWKAFKVFTSLSTLILMCILRIIQLLSYLVSCCRLFESCTVTGDGQFADV